MENPEPPQSTRRTSWWDDVTARLARIERNQHKIMGNLRIVEQQEAKMAVDFTAMNAELARNTSLTGSIADVVNKLVALLNNIPPSTDPVTQAALDDLKTSLAANDDAIAAAVIAGTPAAPPTSRRG